MQYVQFYWVIHVKRNIAEVQVPTATITYSNYIGDSPTAITWEIRVEFLCRSSNLISFC
ncbi:hypothetical protein M758_UG033100 [Ceratodon purpureus]|nr:hypothetical protein M758_UG033100 [Ceratodon purpureus]